MFSKSFFSCFCEDFYRLFYCTAQQPHKSFPSIFLSLFKKLFEFFFLCQRAGEVNIASGFVSLTSNVFIISRFKSAPSDEWAGGKKSFNHRYCLLSLFSSCSRSRLEFSINQFSEKFIIRNRRESDSFKWSVLVWRFICLVIYVPQNEFLLVNHRRSCCVWESFGWVFAISWCALA